MGWIPREESSPIFLCSKSFSGQQYLFNVLATGIAQFRKNGDTWTTTRRTKSLFDYRSVNEMLMKNCIDVKLFEKYHLYNPF